MNSAIRNWLGYTTLALMIAALFMVFDYVPPEAEQGIAQLIFYFTCRSRGCVRVVRGLSP